MNKSLVTSMHWINRNGSPNTIKELVPCAQQTTNIRFTVLSLSFYLVLGLSGCLIRTDKLLVLINKDTHQEGTHFSSSLIENGTSHLVSFYLGCSDCQPYSNLPYYVFHKQDDFWLLERFDRTTRYEPIQFEPPVEFIAMHLKTLETEEIQLPNVIRSAYRYHEVHVKFDSIDFRYAIKDYEREANASSQRLVLVHQLAKIVEGIPDEAWKPIDYK